MMKLGFTREEQDVVFQLTAAVLHIGNIQLAADGDGSKVSDREVWTSNLMRVLLQAPVVLGILFFWERAHLHIASSNASDLPLLLFLSCRSSRTRRTCWELRRWTWSAPS